MFTYRRLPLRIGQPLFDWPVRGALISMAHVRLAAAATSDDFGLR